MSRRTRVVFILALTGWTLSGVPDRVQEQRKAVADLASERGAASAGGVLLAILADLSQATSVASQSPAVWRFTPGSTCVPSEARPVDGASRYADRVAALRGERACRAIGSFDVARSPASVVLVDDDLYLVVPALADVTVAWWPPIQQRIEAGTGIPLQVGGEPPGARAILPGYRLAGVPVWSLPTPATEAAFDLFDGGTVVWLLLLGALLVREYVNVRREDGRERDRQTTRDAILQRLSHELRTPAASVRSLVDALDHPATSDADRGQFLELVRSEAERLSTGIDRLLQAARGDVHLAVDPVAIDLAEWADGVRTRWATRLPGLVVNAERPSPSVADPERLDEAVDALLDNARKYGGPTVILTVGPGRLSVEDDGEGIAAADRARVLQKFERVEGRVNDPGGHGLGLWAVNEVARGHRGRLTIEGRNRFVVTLA